MREATSATSEKSERGMVVDRVVRFAAGRSKVELLLGRGILGRLLLLLLRSPCEALKPSFGNIRRRMRLIDDVFELLVGHLAVEDDLGEFEDQHRRGDFSAGVALEIGDAAGEEGILLQDDADLFGDEGGELDVIGSDLGIVFEAAEELIIPSAVDDVDGCSVEFIFDGGLEIHVGGDASENSGDTSKTEIGNHRGFGEPSSGFLDGLQDLLDVAARDLRLIDDVVAGVEDVSVTDLEEGSAIAAEFDGHLHADLIPFSLEVTSFGYEGMILKGDPFGQLSLDGLILGELSACLFEEGRSFGSGGFFRWGGVLLGIFSTGGK